MMANKAYNVFKAEFYDDEGKAITDVSDTAKLIDTLNVKKSKVHIQSPTAAGAKPIEMTLEEYLWSVDEMAVGKYEMFKNN